MVGLLRRWLWRDATVGGSGRAGAGAVLRRAVQAIDEDEGRSAQRLLRLVSGETSVQPDLRAHQLNRAAGRVNVALLAQLNRAKLDDERAQSVVNEQVEAIQAAWPAVEDWLKQESNTEAISELITARLNRLPLFRASSGR